MFIDYVVSHNKDLQRFLLNFYIDTISQLRLIPSR